MNKDIQNLLKNRYYLDNENSWSDIAKRICFYNSKMYNDILEMKFIPSSPTIMNGNTAGKTKGTLSSCFPMKIDDSVDGIYQALKEGALVTKSGGGVGYDFSILRSSKEKINSCGGNSHGPLSFVNSFNSMLDDIRQAGKRRGAGMLMLDITHPDIWQFIHAKKENGKFNRFNFSVKINDKFYEILENNPESIHMVQLVTTKEWIPLEVNNKRISVKELWDEIISLAWEKAEPGIFNADLAYNQCTTTNVSQTVLSNPCLTGDTLIAVADGRVAVSIKQLVEEKKDIPVFTLNHKGVIEVKNLINPRLTQRNAEIYKVTFDSGLEIKCTKNHSFLNTDGLLIKAINLKKGDSIKSVNKHQMKLSEAYFWMKKKKGQDYYFIENNGKFQAEHRLISEYVINRKLKHNEVVHHINYKGLDNSLNNLEVMLNYEHINFHRKDQIGKKNSVYKIKNREKWKENLSIKHSGMGNGNSKKITNDDICILIKEYSQKTIGNYFSKLHWDKFNLPILNTTKNTYRYNNIDDYCKQVEVEYINSVEYIKLDKQYKNLISNNFNFFLDKIKREFYIIKECEFCSKRFTVDYEHRQATFCSNSCLHTYIDKPYMLNSFKFSKRYLKRQDVQNRITAVYQIYQDYKKGGFTNFKKENKIANNQIRPRNPFAPSVAFIKKNIDNVFTREDVIKVAEENLENFKDKHELSEACSGFNHKVVSVEYIGKDDVYDGTVEKNHSILIGGKKFTNSFGKKSTEWIVTGQCSEFTGIPYSSCNLGSINLSKFVDNGGFFNKDAFENIIIESVIFLNNVIDNNEFPLQQIEHITKKIRPIGLGFMGLGHLAYKLKMGYNSKEFLDFCDNLMMKITYIGMKTSIELAKTFGSYPSFDYDLFLQANKRFFDKEYYKSLLPELKEYGIYNSCITSIAPTGSISFIANTSSGVEPVFALAYNRKIEHLNGEFETVNVVDPIFKEYIKDKYPEREEDIYNEVIKNNGSCQNSTVLTDEEKSIFVTAQDISSDWHLKILGVIARNTSLSVSKTINLPKNVSKEEISKIFMKVRKENIIGVTIYREGSREGILLTETKSRTSICNAKKRPEILNADIHRVTVKGEKWLVIVGLLDDKPYEVFSGKISVIDIPTKVTQLQIKKAKKGCYQILVENKIIVSDINKAFENFDQEAVTRLISTSLRHNVPLQFIIEQINKSKGSLSSYEKSIARALKKYIKEGTESTETCPECNNKLLFIEGCIKCNFCGFSKCS